MYKIVFILFMTFASNLLASVVNLSTPTSALTSYYAAINEGDLRSLKKIMAEESYHTDVQVYALSIAFGDPAYHTELKNYENSEASRTIVEKEVAKKLKKRKTKNIDKLEEISLGTDRIMIRFIEDTKAKQLYLRKYDNGWKIDYLAGRKTN